MPRDAKGHLQDILDAAGRIAAFTSGRALDDYLTDEMLRSPVERQITIMGEAIVQLNQLSPSIASQISDYRSIIGFRNRLIHGYATIADKTVWDIAQTYLPVLIKKTSALPAGPAPFR